MGGEEKLRRDDIAWGSVSIRDDVIPAVPDCVLIIWEGRFMSDLEYLLRLCCMH